MFSNTLRYRVVRQYADYVLRRREDVPLIDNPAQRGWTKARTGGLCESGLIEASFSMGRWSVNRFQTVMHTLREKAYSRLLPNDFATALESLGWAILSNTAADGDTEDEEADSQLWTRYSIAIENRSGPLPQPTDPESIMLLMGMRSTGLEYFQGEVEKIISTLDNPDLEAALYFLTKYRAAGQLLEFVGPMIIDRIPEERRKREVFPRLMVLAVLNADSVGAVMLNTIATLWADSITSEAANSALEYSAHLQRPSCSRLIIDQYGELLTAEGVVAAMIPCCARGVDHLIAVLELLIMDKCQQLTEKNLREGENGPVIYDETVDAIGQNDSAAAFAVLVPPCAYLFLVLAAAGGYSRPDVVAELIQFYEDPCAALLEGRVTQAEHARFVRDLFHLVCACNFTAIVWALIMSKWHPHDTRGALKNAIDAGHQSMVHILLDALLIPDSRLDIPAASVPAIFRKSEAVALLPLVAQRFPSEVSWFLTVLSSLPIPGCIPLGENQEAQVRSAAITGTRLGLATLAEVTGRSPDLNPMMMIWSRLNTPAQLRGTALGPGGAPAAECVICMAPEAFLTEPAALDGRKSWVRQTSPFIRLLETGEEDIILQPIMQALMEYHWTQGKFWYRFAAHIILSLGFLGCMWAMFESTVRRDLYGIGTNPASVIPVTVVTLMLSALFITQECREYMDSPYNYIRSSSNLLDLVIYLSTVYCAIQGVFREQYVPPLLLGITLVFYCTRVLMQLRIIPSIGPIIRTFVSATKAIFPVLVPFVVLAISFAGAFHLIQMQFIFASPTQETWHFRTIPDSIQSVLTMTSGDYSVLDYSTNSQVFFLRLLFHLIFIIFLINLIIGLMTVNVANITTNATSAWLVEIAQLIVELELYWPWPTHYRKRDLAPLPSQRGGKRQPKKGSKSSEPPLPGPGKSGGPRPPSSKPRFSYWKPWTWSSHRGLKSKNKIRPYDDLPPDITITAIMSPEQQQSIESVIVESEPVVTDALRRRVVLYTCPEEQVALTSWWKNAATNARTAQDRKENRGGGGGAPDLLRQGASVRHSFQSLREESNAVSVLNLRGENSRNQKVASVPSMVGRSQTSLPPVPSAANAMTEQSLTAPIANMDMMTTFLADPMMNSHIWGGNSRMEDVLTDQDEQNMFSTVRNRRSSKMTRRSSNNVSASNLAGRGDSSSQLHQQQQQIRRQSSGLGLPTASVKELGDQLNSMKEAVAALERTLRTDSRNQRERTRRLELSLDSDRQRCGDASAATAREVQALSQDLRLWLGMTGTSGKHNTSSKALHRPSHSTKSENFLRRILPKRTPTESRSLSSSHGDDPADYQDTPEGPEDPEEPEEHNHE
ncbi:uncharacterized protein EV422DRAFT_564380 [Fimicolochytrium jonesii]|uniref:uncharacterized protein n=1 Tax=Fimicolochytrium jonesii TaxID=1396493 RepID=UPI0022FE1B29|nr:uncharacterized protein EV422DRAFT_564380 [Fimicolochytrium jonesii]KAI8825027.1 hypothetical protein EV422DRAFT_564380 [Fimicolochytrium jonesii]